MNIEDLGKLPDAEGHKILAELSTPGLDRYRQGIKVTLTSVLILEPQLLRADPMGFCAKLGVTEQEILDDQERVEMICGAALLAINDEIDRRIPIPDPPKCKVRWREGMITPPGEPERPSGPCSLLDGHEGDHIFPNNNRQPQRPKTPNERSK